ncbi:hypothetical protein, partial [Achromobacter aegrifaciens]|uniref:hypothetical protein n=1 Tax=Achromobacter aegrifaciens TaxID=1287736 RepID=UPI000F90567C
FTQGPVPFGRAIESALLSKLRAPVALPAGYALVPIEPTPEMIEAGATERITPHASAGHGAVAGYKAMLAAAPVASAPVAGEATYYAVIHGQALFGVFETETAANECIEKSLHPGVMSIRPLYAAPQASEAVRLRRIAWLIGSIFVHGDFKAETGNERELEKLLRENGTFWDSLEQFDAALSAQPGAQK